MRTGVWHGINGGTAVDSVWSEALRCGGNNRLEGVMDKKYDPELMRRLREDDDSILCLAAADVIERQDAEIERLKKICKENDYGSRLDESKTISGKTSTRCRQTLGRKP